MTKNLFLFLIILGVGLTSCVNDSSQPADVVQEEVEPFHAEIEVTKVITEQALNFENSTDERVEFTGEVYPIIQYESKTPNFLIDYLPAKFDVLNDGQIVQEDGTILYYPQPETLDSKISLLNTYIRLEMVDSFDEGEEYDMEYDALIKIYDPSRERYRVVLIIEDEPAGHGLATIVDTLHGILYSASQ